MPLRFFTTQRPQPDSRAVPIVLGVTGHRDLRVADLARLQRAVAAICDDFARYLHTPLVLLSSLAQGADQLCATVALEKGLQVIAPLPFPAALYRQSSSFDNDEARHQLDTLLQHPRVASFVVPLPEEEMPSDDAGWTRLLDAPETRHRCYANAGGYVVLHCHALIALWDGERSDASAGTAQMVQFKRTGRPPQTYPWTQPLFHWADSGPVYVVHTPRASAPGTRRRTAGSRQIYYPSPASAEGSGSAQQAPTAMQRKGARQQRKHEKQRFKAMCRSINSFNRRLRASPQPSEQEVLARLLGQDVPPVPDGLSRLALLREAASAPSRSFSGQLHRLTFTVFGLIGLAALAFHLYAHPLGGSGTSHPPGSLWTFILGGNDTPHPPGSLGIFIGLLIVAFIMVKVVQFCHLERRALDYRALAEALRVQIYWLAAGLNESVAANYLQQVRSELSWIRQAVQACSLRPHEGCAAFDQLPFEQQLDWLHRVGQHWLAGQQRYYHTQHDTNHRAYTTWRRLGWSLAVLGWLLALGFMVGDLRPEVADRVLAAVTMVTQSVAQFWPYQETPDAVAPDSHVTAVTHHGWSASEPPHWLLVLSGMLVVTGGLCIAYNERRAYEELARQYNRMHVLFAHGIEALQCHLESKDVRAAQDVLRDMGCEALTENAGWLILRRARPFELPVH